MSLMGCKITKAEMRHFQRHWLFVNLPFTKKDKTLIKNLFELKGDNARHLIREFPEKAKISSVYKLLQSRDKLPVLDHFCFRHAPFSTTILSKEYITSTTRPSNPSRLANPSSTASRPSRPSRGGARAVGPAGVGLGLWQGVGLGLGLGLVGVVNFSELGLRLG